MKNHELMKTCIQLSCAAALLVAAPTFANSQNANDVTNPASPAGVTNPVNMNTAPAVGTTDMAPGTAGPADRAAFREGSGSVGDYMDDAMITASVKAHFVGQKGVDTMDISVETNQGVVRLTGEVNDPAQIPLAEKTAMEVDGVRSVINDLQYRPE